MFTDDSHDPPRRQRVAAYAVIVRGSQDDEDDSEILLSRLAPYLAPDELWTLPGGGIEFGEHPRDAVVREVYEETGLKVSVGERAWVDSACRRTNDPTVPVTEMQSLRTVFVGWVPQDSPEPRVVEIDGSTVDARWHRLGDIHAGTVPTTRLVSDALAALRPAQLQRLSAYAVLLRDGEILLSRNSRRGPHPGVWTLPGGGVEHGEPPSEAVRREVAEETGLDLAVGALLGVHDTHFTGTAPSGRIEDYHGVHLIYEGIVDPAGRPSVRELDGTTDEACWIPVAAVRSGAIEVLDVVVHALALTEG